MKIRKGFVSNSSSTSFTCEVCGSEVSGMDMGLSEAEMVECNNGHTFCENHKLSTESETDLRKKIKNYIEGNYKDGDFKTKYLKQLDEIEVDDEEELRYFAENFFDTYANASVEECPICQFQSLRPIDINKYLYKKYETCGKEIIKELREKFKSYKDFKEWLKV